MIQHVKIPVLGMAGAFGGLFASLQDVLVTIQICTAVVGFLIGILTLIITIKKLKK